MMMPSTISPSPNSQASPGPSLEQAPLFKARRLLSFVDSVVHELLAEEVRLKSHARNGLLSMPNQTVLVVLSKSSSSSQN